MFFLNLNRHHHVAAQLLPPKNGGCRKTMCEMRYDLNSEFLPDKQERYEIDVDTPESP